MPNFTADQLQDEANAYNDMAVNTGQVRLRAIHAGQPLDDPGIVNLLGVSLSLANQASTYAAQAANVTLDDIATAATTIKNATDQANAELKKLNDVDKAINIGAAGIILATSVFTEDPSQIASAAKGVLDAVIAKPGAPASTASTAASSAATPAPATTAKS